MALQKMFSSMGAASPSVDTVLTSAEVSPGGVLSGEVHVDGGSNDSEVEFVGVGLIGAVETEDGEEIVEVDQVDLADGFFLEAGGRYTVPFSLKLPWDLPLTHMYGQRLDRMQLGIRTELGLYGERDKGDMDEIIVRPLHAQAVIFDALERGGFSFVGAELELGELDIEGVEQSLPCFQEIEFVPPRRYAGKLDEIDLTFVAGSRSMEVVLFIGKRGGILHAAGEEVQVFTVRYSEVDEIDWVGQLDDWIAEAAKQRGIAF